MEVGVVDRFGVPRAAHGRKKPSVLPSPVAGGVRRAGKYALVRNVRGRNQLLEPGWWLLVVLQVEVERHPELAQLVGTPAPLSPSDGWRPARGARAPPAAR